MEKYDESCRKWRELVKKIFGTENITWRLDPESGQIFFSTNGIEQIKATVVFLALTRNIQDRVRWAWAWAGKNRNLRLIPDDNRITPEDIAEYLKEGGTFEEPNLFKSECIDLAVSKKGSYYLKYMRAKIMEMLDGQFIFEGDINGSNAIFVILKAKKIKQKAPEPEPEKTESKSGQSRESNEESDEKESPRKASTVKTPVKKDDSDEE
jgi:hypothetical protein